jgi:hypothetical protein
MDKIEKKQFNITEIELIKIPFSGSVIEVLPYIPYQTRFDIINGYVQYLLDEKEIMDGYHRAEGWVFTKILLDCTNIDTNIKDDGLTVEYIYASGIWLKVKENIIDYEDLRQEIEDAVRLVLKDKYSSKQVFNEITKFVDGFINSDKVKDVVSQLENGKKMLSTFYPNIKENDGVIIPDEIVANKIEEAEVPVKKPRKTRVKKF